MRKGCTKKIDASFAPGLHDDMWGVRWRDWAGAMISVSVAWAVAKAGDPGVYPRDDREQARAWYLRHWAEGNQWDFGFTGSLAELRAGETSPQWRNSVLHRINLFRRIAGLQPVVEDSTYTRQCQAGALLLGARGEKSHQPPSSWPGWTQEAAAACAQSNLGVRFPRYCPIQDFMIDFGVPSLGHREALLTPGLKRTGLGAAPDRAYNDPQWAVVLVHIADPSFVDPDPALAEPFVAWPAAGWFPNALLPGRWSLTPADFSTRTGSSIDMSQARVGVTRNGVTMPSASEAPGGGRLLFTLDGDSRGMGTTAGVVNGVQAPGFDFMPGVGIDFGYGEIRAYGLRADTEDPFADVVYEVTVTGIRDLFTGGLWRGTGEYRYTVRTFDHQWGSPVPGQSRLINLSTRSPIRTGQGVQVGGFAVRGAGSLPLLLRGVGPALTPFGVVDALADPQLELHGLPDGGTPVALGYNDNWGTGVSSAEALRQLAARSGAFAWADGSADAALSVTLAAGNYSATVAGRADSVGNGMVEIYAAGDGTGAELINLSSRTFVSSGGDREQVAGFVLQGELPRTVFIRITGQDLQAFGIRDPLPYPFAELFDGQNRMVETQGIEVDEFIPINGAPWRKAERVAAFVGAFPAARGLGSCAMVQTLEPGRPYTVVVRGLEGVTTTASQMKPRKEGHALVELYVLP